jgi:hypothetical protein
VKPFPKTQPDQRSTVDHIGENGEIMIMNPEKQGKDGRKIFSFNKIFAPNVSQCTSSNFSQFLFLMYSKSISSSTFVKKELMINRKVMLSCLCFLRRTDDSSEGYANFLSYTVS